MNYIHDIVDGRALGLLRLFSRLCATERMTCSQAVKNHVGLSRTTVVYAAIDVARFAVLPEKNVARAKLGLADDGIPIVGLVGRIARWKGQDRFIRIAAAVLRERDAHFCIIGSPIFGCDVAYVEELHSAIEQLGLERNISFVPWQDDMRPVYAAIDVACNCSAREPFGRTSLEALASGVPIVCFDDAGVCEVFEQNRGGIRVTPGDEHAFARAIVAHLDATDGAAVRAQARAAAQTMDVSMAYRAFIESIERVAGRVLDPRPVSFCAAADSTDLPGVGMRSETCPVQ
jgi:glycosyltransferase involved in cell wall biosynthesis